MTKGNMAKGITVVYIEILIKKFKHFILRNSIGNELTGDKKVNKILKDLLKTSIWLLL